MYARRGEGKERGDRRDIIVEMVNRPDENGITAWLRDQKWKWYKMTGRRPLARRHARYLESPVLFLPHNHPAAISGFTIGVRNKMVMYGRTVSWPGPEPIQLGLL